jgi:hypothetical protein
MLAMIAYGILIILILRLRGLSSALILGLILFEISEPIREILRTMLMRIILFFRMQIDCLDRFFCQNPALVQRSSLDRLGRRICTL